MQEKVPFAELAGRMRRFYDLMDRENPGWETAVIFGKINQYYFTGTMQDGMLLIPRDRDPVFFVRRSHERAVAESDFPDIRPMKSFRDAAGEAGTRFDQVFLEMELVPLALFLRFRKYFPFRETAPLDTTILKVRALKSPFELGLLERSGALHQKVLEEDVPGLLQAGMSEAEFGVELYRAMVREGHHGLVRFGMFDTEIVAGQLGFGESSIYPTYFDGPGGAYGLGAATPVLGSRERRLKPGDLVFIDTGFGIDGYHTDKTMTYMFGKPLPGEAIAAHTRCVEIQDKMASLLKPGNTPEQVYTTVTEELDEEFRKNFMGFADRRVLFLGHGVGLQVDEYPVISKGYQEPFQEGMVIALEPKKGIPGVGMVGIENTYIVTPSGGRSITGTSKGLIPVFP
jgi:Xaa-Pro aminopeptidase